MAIGGEERKKNWNEFCFSFIPFVHEMNIRSYVKAIKWFISLENVSDIHRGIKIKYFFQNIIDG